jgi:hypothetical protein
MVEICFKTIKGVKTATSKATGGGKKKNPSSGSPMSPLLCISQHVLNLCLGPEKPLGKRKKSRKFVGNFGCFVLL